MHIEDPRPPDKEARAKEIVRVLARLWTYSFTTKSDEARYYADEIAELACRGLITTAVRPSGDLYGRLWKVTDQGLSYLYAHGRETLDQMENEYVERHA